MTEFMPTPDHLTVAWGWFQFLLLFTFPLHLLAMNAMLGSAGIAVFQHFRGGEAGKKLAYRIAVALPLVIAFAVNFGVAPLLFLQVLYGHLIYSSSILMGAFWIMVIPLIILAYYGAYLYDFRFNKLGKAGPWILLLVVLMFITIGYFFSNNMLLMLLTERFPEYVDHRGGTMLASSDGTFIPRYVHMMVSAFAVGGLFTAIIGQIRKKEDPELADKAKNTGMRIFAVLTMVNILLGVWFLIALPKSTMMLFMGQNMVATVLFMVSLVLTIGVIMTAVKRLIWWSTGLTVVLVYCMAFMRAYVRMGYLEDVFALDQLKVIPQYSPMILFLVTLVIGLGIVAWMIRKTVIAMRS